MTNWNIEKLSKCHISNNFTCGEEALDIYIKQHASQDVKRKLGQVFVAIEASNNIIGYYTISASSFKKNKLPVALAKKLPGYPVPAAIIGRLAVDKSHHGKRLGEFLLTDALYRICDASKAMAVYAVIVDAKNNKAEEFYKKYGFIPFIDSPDRLFLPLKTIEKTL